MPSVVDALTTNLLATGLATSNGVPITVLSTNLNPAGKLPLIIVVETPDVLTSGSEICTCVFSWSTPSDVLFGTAHCGNIFSPYTILPRSTGVDEGD